MKKFVKGMVIVAMIWLAGCASAERQVETFGYDSKSAAATMRACEGAVYYSSEYDRQIILGCANVLDIWQ